MSAANASTFKVGLVQMRSGVDPQANLAAALAAIDEAKRAGADYVLTPEMTNIMESKRERLFADDRGRGATIRRSPRLREAGAQACASTSISARWRSRRRRTRRPTARS